MLASYIKIAFKVLLRRKFFTFISLFAISFTLVGLVVATAILDHMLAPMAPETKLDRTLGIFYMDMSGPESQWNGNPGYGLLNKYSRGLANVEKFSIFSQELSVTSFKDGAEITSMLKRTDGAYWEILEFTFLSGRPITDDDEKNANFVAVINQATEQKFFGGEPGLGKFIEADRQRFQVVGVVENVPLLRHVPYADIWVPNSTSPQVSEKDQLMGGYLGLILARDKADFAGIKAEFRSRLPMVVMTDPEYKTMNGGPETFFESLSREIVGESNAALLLGAIIFGMLMFMLLPTLNLININVSRIFERSSEIGVRKSFGASSWTLVGQFIVENLILTLIGGLIGFVIAGAVLAALNDSELIQYARLQLNLRIFGYGFLMILVFGLLSGVYPAWKMSRIHPVLALKGAVR